MEAQGTALPQGFIKREYDETKEEDMGVSSAETIQPTNSNPVAQTMGPMQGVGNVGAQPSGQILFE